MLAICSGIVVYGAFDELFSGYQKLAGSGTQILRGTTFGKTRPRRGGRLSCSGFHGCSFLRWRIYDGLFQAFACRSAVAGWWYHLLCLSADYFYGENGLSAAWQIRYLGHVAGLALFGFTYTQAILVAALVEITGGVAADAMSGRVSWERG